MDVGTTLRTARERHGVSIEQLAATTRITVPLLRAVETNAFEKVPSGIFARGFIRSYAREVGLDPEEMVEQFLQESGDMTGIPEPHIAAAELDDDVRAAEFNSDEPSGRAAWGYALIVAALLVGYISSVRTGESSADPTTVEARELSGAAETSGVVTVEPRAVATTGASGLLRLEIAPSGPCWVEAVVDGKSTIYRLMQGGERETLSAREIALRVGDPATFVYQINGRAGRTLGAAGKTVSVKMTADTYQTFLEN
jgi:cytoskeleton protein RodZ